MEQCRSFFEGAALPVPFIPGEQQRNIVATGRVFSTRKESASIYGIEDCVRELLSQPTEDYVLLGAGGHGIASQGLHYYAVKGPLALFIQLDAQLDPEKIKQTFIAIEKFYTALEKIAVPPNRRFVFVESQYREELNGYGWIDGQPGKFDKKWHTTQPNLLYMDAFLELAKSK